MASVSPIACRDPLRTRSLLFSTFLWTSQAPESPNTASITQRGASSVHSRRFLMEEAWALARIITDAADIPGRALFVFRVRSFPACAGDGRYRLPGHWGRRRHFFRFRLLSVLSWVLWFLS